MEFVQISAEYAENQVLSGGVSAILRSGLILENIRRMFLLSIWVTGTMYMNFDEKHSPNVLENPTRLQNSTDHQKELDFPHTVLYLKKKSIRYKSRYSKTSYLKRSQK